MSNNNSADEEDSFDEDIDMDEDFNDIESKQGIVENFDARRRLEEHLDNKALERLINGDFYDD